MNKIFSHNSEGRVPARYSDDELRTQGWPVDYDFETDHICQTVFQPFIEDQLATLEEYDSKRNHLSDYHFHIHAREAAQDVKQTCLNLGLGEKVANNMYYATLIHDLGKPELDPTLWDKAGKPSEDENAQKRQHIHTGVAVFRDFLDGIPDNAMRNKARSHQFVKLALDVIRNHHERLDGKGENGLTAEQISMPVRLVCIVEDYDGNSHLRPSQIAEGQKNDPPSIFEKMESHKREGSFDPVLYAAFKDMKLEQYQQILDAKIEKRLLRKHERDLSLET